ncbi:unnamed protein product [Ascophyllum nodosum]
MIRCGLIRCSGSLVLFVLLSLVVDWRRWDSPGQQGHCSYLCGWLRSVGVVAGADPWEISGDGMFDPRRDYWSNSTSIWGSTDVRSPPSPTTHGRRELATAESDCGAASSSTPCCIECFGLSYCDVLNGYKVEDKYYPGEPTMLGSCDNLEDRASRLEVFGPSKTFRDTDACREMVLDYTCLWWGSANEMYDNRCGVEAQVYPCRSYCVQLAKTCANNVLDWQELCRAIDCPPTDDECMPGPYIQDTDEACYLYEYHSPLSAGRRSALPSALLGTWFYPVAIIAIAFG